MCCCLQNIFLKFRYYFTIYKIGYYICGNNKALINDIKPTDSKELFSRFKALL